MPGERNLETLLTHAAPQLRDDVFVFCAASEGETLPADLQPVLQFREDEGTTLVILRDDALRLGWAHEFPCRWITLSVDSALDAVGFLAVVTARLAAAGIAVNAVLPKAATTISAGDPVPDHAAHYPAGLREAFAPLQYAEAVAPLVLYLASEECTVNGEAYAAGLGRYARVFVGEAPGWSAKDPLGVEPEDIAARLEEIRNIDGFCIPADIYDELSFIAGLIGVATAS